MAVKFVHLYREGTLKPKTKRTRKVVFWVLGFLGLLLVGIYIGSVFMVKDMFTHRVEKVAFTPEELGLPAETISLTSSDGIELKAWWIPAEQNSQRAVVVLLHGMDGLNASSLLPQVGFLREAGYAVLDLDMRAHGRSGGERIGLAFEEPRDVSAALDWIQNQPELKDAPVILLGYSMGGAAAIRTAAIRPDVDAVISVSAFSSIDRMISQGMRLMGAPEWIITVFGPFSRLGMLTIYGAWPAAASPEHDIPMISPRPVILIHGTADSQIPVENAYRLQKAGGENVQLQIVKGADHLIFIGDGTGPEDADFRQMLLQDLEMVLP